MDTISQALQNGFAGESQTVQRYQAYALQAEHEAVSANTERAELLRELAQLFREIAADEQSHAAAFLKAMGDVGETARNLAQAIERETGGIARYTSAAQAARAEGKEELALAVERIASDEKRHLDAYRKMLERLMTIPE